VMSRIDATTCVDLRVVQGRRLHVAEVVLEVARVERVRVERPADPFEPLVALRVRRSARIAMNSS
jgi:hypothetical protein